MHYVQRFLRSRHPQELTKAWKKVIQLLLCSLNCNPTFCYLYLQQTCCQYSKYTSAFETCLKSKALEFFTLIPLGHLAKPISQENVCIVKHFQNLQIKVIPVTVDCSCFNMDKKHMPDMNWNTFSILSFIQTFQSFP